MFIIQKNLLDVYILKINVESTAVCITIYTNLYKLLFKDI